MPARRAVGRLAFRRGRGRHRFGGSWRFTPEGGGTRVDYRVAMDVRAPVPGFILRKITDGLVSASLPRMFTSIEPEVRRRQGPLTWGLPGMKKRSSRAAQSPA